MAEIDVLQEFEQAGALMKGHFILSSGRRSPVFLQKAIVFCDAERTARLCAALADKLQVKGYGPFDVIVSPAVGGIIPGYEMGRQMGLPAMFVEREDGVFRLRRGFSLEPGQRVLMMEDIVTTGLSSRECIAAIQEEGGDVVTAACLVDRSGGKADLGVPFVPLAMVDFPSYAEDDLPADLAALPAVKPGSRGLA